MLHRVQFLGIAGFIKYASAKFELWRLFCRAEMKLGKKGGNAVENPWDNSTL